MGGDDRLRGAVLGLGSALLFGLGAPVSKLLLPRAQVLVAGAALLGRRGEWSGSGAGAAAIALACACWALDNNLAARLALKDPVRVLRIKALCAGALNLALSLALGQSLPPIAACAAALALGSVSYGASLLLYLRAQRVLGAARQGALFAAAPFAGAAAAGPPLGGPPPPPDVVAAGPLVAGVAAPLSPATR